jgi:hypothetical protein
LLYIKVKLYNKSKLNLSNKLLIKSKYLYYKKPGYELKDCFKFHPEKLADFKAKYNSKKDYNYNIKQLALPTALVIILFIRLYWILDIGTTTYIINDYTDYIKFSK